MCVFYGAAGEKYLVVLHLDVLLFASLLIIVRHAEGDFANF